MLYSAQYEQTLSALHEPDPTVTLFSQLHEVPSLNGGALNAVSKLYYKGVKGCSKMIIYVVNKIKFLSAKMRGV